MRCNDTGRRVLVCLLTKGSSGSSLGCGESSTPENLPVPYLIVLLVPWLEMKESVFVEAVRGRYWSLDTGIGGGGTKLSLMSSGRDSSLIGAPCDGNSSFVALPRRGDDTVLGDELGDGLGLALGDSITGGKGGSVFRILTLSRGGVGKLFSISAMSMVDSSDTGRDMTITTARSEPLYF